MSVTSINTTTFLSDSIIYIRELLRGQISGITGITDPISSTRPSGQRFLMTLYPDRASVFPVVTIVDRGIQNMQKGGMQSEVLILQMNLEIRVWGRNQEETDKIAQQIIDVLRDNQLSTGGMVASNAYDFSFGAMVNIPESGLEGIKSKIIPISFISVIGE